MHLQSTQAAPKNLFDDMPGLETGVEMVKRTEVVPYSDLRVGDTVVGQVTAGGFDDWNYKVVRVDGELAYLYSVWGRVVSPRLFKDHFRAGTDLTQTRWSVLLPRPEPERNEFGVVSP